MTINIQYINVDLSTSLTNFTKEKLEKLFHKYEFIISANVSFKKEDRAHETGKICNIELRLPGPVIFATSEEHNYEVAVRETISDLDRQLKKRKQTFKSS